MARDVEVIQQEMVNDIQSDPTLSVKLTSNSKIAVWRLITYVIAVAHWLLEVLFDEHRQEVSDILATQNTHNLKWYALKAKSFQYGYNLVQDTDEYATIDEEAMIVSHAAVDEINGKLFMKVAKDNAGELGPLSTAAPDELTPFREYIFRVKDAGVIVNVISDEGDDLGLSIDIFYNPLLLNENGFLLSDSSREPAKDTIKSFIKTLPFNGQFVPTHLVDALQVTEGVDFAVILSCQTKFANNDWVNVDGKVVPSAGYLTVSDEDLIINYRPNV